MLLQHTMYCMGLLEYTSKVIQGQQPSARHKQAIIKSDLCSCALHMSCGTAWQDMQDIGATLAICTLLSHLLKGGLPLLSTSGAAGDTGSTPECAKAASAATEAGEAQACRKACACP